MNDSVIKNIQTDKTNYNDNIKFLDENNELINVDLAKALITYDPKLPKLLGESEQEFYKIAIRSYDDPCEFHTFTKETLKKIADEMPEINRATRAFGRMNSQISSKFMTTTLLHGIISTRNPYRILKQCVTEIEHRRQAIKYNYFKLKVNQAKLERQMRIFMQIKDNPKIPIERKKELAATINQSIADMSDLVLYIEGALKDIAVFQDVYKQIAEKTGVYGKWDEEDYEKMEIRSHVRRGFELLYRDRLKGVIENTIVEYFQQLGIHPQQAIVEVDEFIAEQWNKAVNKQLTDSSKELEEFLDRMEDKYAENYKYVMNRLGFDTLLTDWALYKNEIKDAHKCYNETVKKAQEVFSDTEFSVADPLNEQLNE